jgi:putative chitobiose transport system permease protein
MKLMKNLYKFLGSYVILVMIAIATLFPLVWLASTSLKSPTENVFAQLLPQTITLSNFQAVWSAYPFGQYLWNSLVIALITVAGNLLLCALAAYPLARFDFRGRKLIFIAIVTTITIPFQIVMIPLYILAVQLGLRNSYLGVIFPNVVSAFGIFLLKQGFESVPKELEEAARMDGCSELGLWWHIMIPAIRPGLITLGMFVFIASWSDLLWPMIILDRPETYTLPLGLTNLAGALNLDWRMVAAGSIISLAPVLTMFIALQKFIIPNDIVTGVKG